MKNFFYRLFKFADDVILTNHKEELIKKIVFNRKV